MSIVLASVLYYAESIFLFAFLMLLGFTIYKIFKSDLPTFGMLLGTFLFVLSFCISAVCVNVTERYSPAYYALDFLSILIRLSAVFVLAFNLLRKKNP